jgi:hypothetical protein
MMCVVYVDDSIFASLSIDNLEREITSLGINSSVQCHTFTLRNEWEVCAFLGIHLKKVTLNTFLLAQSGLIDHALSVTGLTDCNGFNTPLCIDPGYATVISILMDLAGNIHADIAYAVHQAARFTHCARNSHAAGIKRILRYLKRTCTKGLILNPGTEKQVMPILAGCFLVKTSSTLWVSSHVLDMSKLTVGLRWCGYQRCRHMLH